MLRLRIEVLYLCQMLWVLPSEFEPSNTKALFTRAKAAWGLRNIHQALSDLKEAAQIEPYNSEIAKKMVESESESCQVEVGKRELKGSEQGISQAERPCVQEQPGYKEGNNSEHDEQAQSLEVHMVKVGSPGEETLATASNPESSDGAPSLAAKTK